jgi:hypothetical protein
LPGALSRDVESDAEVLFDLLSDTAIGTDELTMLASRDFNRFRDLILSFIDEGLDGSRYLVENVTRTSDGEAVRFLPLPGELDMFGTCTRAPRFSYNALDIRT